MINLNSPSKVIDLTQMDAINKPSRMFSRTTRRCLGETSLREEGVERVDVGIEEGRRDEGDGSDLEAGWHQ
jgi:hypothetical protein